MTKKRILRGLAFMALLGTLTISAPQPAQAQWVVTDIIGDAFDTFMKAYTIAQDWIKEEEATWATAVQAVSTYLQTQIQTMNVDTTNQNTRQTAETQVAMDIGVQNTRSPYYSACQVAMGASAETADMQDGAATVQAFAQSNANRTASPSSIAQDLIKTDCLFAPTNANLPETVRFKAMGCNTPNPNPHALQDRSIDALLGYLEYDVPPNLAFQNGAYMPITNVPGAIGNRDFWKFTAALAFCQHVTPYQPNPPGNSGTTATVDLVGMQEVIGSQVRTSSTSATCLGALERRMAVGPDVDATLKSRYTRQEDRCEKDYGSFLIDLPALNDCKARGRSELQADHDKAYRRGSTEFHNHWLTQVDNNTERLLESACLQDEERFSDRLMLERQAVIEAIGAGTNGAAAPSPLGAAVNK